MDSAKEPKIGGLVVPKWRATLALAAICVNKLSGPYEKDGVQRMRVCTVLNRRREAEGQCPAGSSA